MNCKCCKKEKNEKRIRKEMGKRKLTYYEAKKISDRWTYMLAKKMDTKWKYFTQRKAKKSGTLQIAKVEKIRKNAAHVIK